MARTATAVSRRHLIDSACTKRMTTRQTPGDQPQRVARSMLRKSGQRVIGAGGQKPTARPDQRADGSPVDLYRRPQHRAHRRAAGLARHRLHVRTSPAANNRSSSDRQSALRARCVSVSNSSGSRLSLTISATPPARLPRLRSDALAMRRTVLRSTARFRSRRGTDMSSTGQLDPSTL